MGLLVGVFVVPDAADPAQTLAQIEAADAGCLDLVGIQDHPYQRRFLDTWTLLSYAAARTGRIRLVPDVANLPLRPPRAPGAPPPPPRRPHPAAAPARRAGQGRGVARPPDRRARRARPRRR